MTDDAPTLRDVLARDGLETLVDRTAGAAAATPAQLGRYLVGEPLGAGGMGEVLGVVDPDVGREIALKLIRGSADPELVRRFVVEAQVTGQLEHPNIVPLYELGATPSGEPYFTMKRVRGRTLEDALAERPPLTRTLPLFLKLCDAMAYAHSRGVVHRDLKPANVMVGAFGELLVMDWGLARLTASSTVRVAAPLPGGGVSGTPAYMPPEQADGSVDVDPRLDVYALGAMLYELLAGRRPYEGDARAILEAVRTRPPAPLPGDVPWELAALVGRAMARDPEQRYATVEQMRDDLLAYVEGRLLRAARYTLTQRLTKWIARHRIAVVVAALVAATGGAVALSRHQAERARQAELGQTDARREAAVQRALGQLRAAIESARPYFYIADIDIQRRLAPVRRALGQVERLLGTPALAGRQELWLLRGEARHFLGEHAAAERALRRAVELGAARADAARPLVRIYVRRAVEATMSSVDRQHGTPETWLARGRAWQADLTAGAHSLSRDVLAVWERVAERDREGVARLAKAALKRHGDALGTEELWLALAWYRAGAAARELHDRAIARCPQHAWAYVLRSTKYAQHEYAARLADLDRALTINPHLEVALLNRAGTHSLAGRPEAALADLARHEALNPEPNADRLSIEARVRWQQGQRERAMELAERAIAARPGDAVASIFRGRLLLRRRADGDLAEAARVAAAMVARAPRYRDCWIFDAEVARAQRDFDRAIASGRKAVALAPDEIEPLLGLAATLLLRDDFAGALPLLEHAAATDPTSADVWLQLGRARLGAGKAPQAIAALDRGLALRPLPSVAGAIHGMRAVARWHTGEREAARRDAEQAIRLAPTEAQGYGVLAMAHLGARRLDETIAVADRGLARVGRNTRTLLELRGRALHARGDHERALADFTRLVREHPSFAWGYYRRAHLLVTMGRNADALDDARRATEQLPKQWETWYLLTVVLDGLGRAGEAAAAARAALPLAPPQVRAQLEATLRRLDPR